MRLAPERQANADREWTMQRIADALNVSKMTISNDLTGCKTTLQPSRPKGGRPKGTRRVRNVARIAPVTFLRGERGDYIRLDFIAGMDNAADRRRAQYEPKTNQPRP
jgi:hypothetical protein